MSVAVLTETEEWVGVDFGVTDPRYTTTCECGWSTSWLLAYHTSRKKYDAAILNHRIEHLEGKHISIKETVARLQTQWDDPAGYCYAASEALYHYLGGKESGLTPKQLRIDLVTLQPTREVRGDTVSHWWLEDKDGNVIDATADQFNFAFPYKLGRGRGFRGMKTESKELLDYLRKESP